MPKTVADRIIDEMYGKKCLFCDSSTNVTKAHLVAGNSSLDYAPFCKPNYKSDLDVKSARNFIRLCGTLGVVGSCHHEFDTYRIALIYNPLETVYRLFSFNPDWPNYVPLHKKIVYLPEECRPYTRLLSWKAKKCMLELGSNVAGNAMDIITRANLSEDSRSIESDLLSS